MAKFKQKPVIIEAVKWDATKESWNAILAIGCIRTRAGKDGSFYIPSLVTGKIKVDVGDYVLKDLTGGFYALEEEIFENNYDPITGE